MKIKIEVCELCKKQKCDGKLYETKKKTGDSFYDNMILCKTNEDVFKRNNRLYYHWVMGHGIEDNFELVLLKKNIKYFDKYGRGFKKNWRI